MVTILCGIDWASDHHDVALIGPGGRKLGRRRISDDAAGLGELTGMFAGHGGGPGTVKIAIETERGLLVASLRAAGYQIYPVNPKAVDRYRDRHHLARGKSDAAAHRLAEVFAAPQMRQPAEVEQAMGDAATAIITTITTMNTTVTALAQRIDANFEQHPDAAIYHSMPALGPILSARVLGDQRRSMNCEPCLMVAGVKAALRQVHWNAVDDDHWLHGRSLPV